MSTAQASATSATTSALLSRRPRTPVVVRVPSRRASDAFVLAVTIAGRSPKTRAVAATTARANSSNRMSMVVLDSLGTEAGSVATASLRIASAAAAPATVPAAASIRLSTSI